MNNIKLLLEYDGTNYHGFQRQVEKHGPTIQGVLEATLGQIVKHDVALIMAGRTDAGVHALGQVVNFHSNTRIPMDKLPKALNSLLPRDIRIKHAEIVDENFNARFSAQWKRYCYTINNAPIASVFSRLYTWHVPQPLDLEAMSAAAALMVGRRDFRAFCAAGSPVKNFVRNLTVCSVGQEEPLIRVTCQADGFLYNMVRIICGTLVDIGKGKIATEEITEILASQQRARGGMTAPPQGLCLEYVQY